MPVRIIGDDFDRGAGKIDRKQHTTRFYGIKFLKGQVSGSFNQNDNSYSECSALCAQNDPVVDLYGARQCAFMVCSMFLIILGVSFVLAGHFTPRKTFAAALKSNDTTSDDIKKARNFNLMLSRFTISGMVMLSVGGVFFSLLLLLPFIELKWETSTRKGRGYRVAPMYQESDFGCHNIQKKGKNVLSSPISMEAKDDSPAFSFAVLHQQLQPPADTSGSKIKRVK